MTRAALCLCVASVVSFAQPFEPQLYFEPPAPGDERCDFVVHSTSGSFRFTPNAFEIEEGRGRRHSFRFDQGNPAARREPIDKLPGVVNYQMGKPELWRAGLPTYARLAYRDVWPGVDVVYYFHGAQLEFDFHIAAGADPARIQLELPDAEAATTNSAGDLTLAGGWVQFRRPRIFQSTPSGTRAVRGDWRIKAGLASFFVGEYNPAYPLTIDPIVVVHTPTNATDITAFAIDPTGNLLLAGKRGDNPLVEKRKADGSLIFSTTYGRPSRFDQAAAVSAGPGGAVFALYDLSNGESFPITGGLPPIRNSPAMIVAKFDSTGRVGYLFGLPGPSYGSIAVDSSGSVAFGGVVQPGLNYIPATPGAFQTSHGGGPTNGILVRINPAGTELTYVTYFGGLVADSVSAMAVDRNDRVLVAGSTCSNTLLAINSLPFRHPLAACRPYVFRWTPSRTTFDYVAVLPVDNSSTVDLALSPDGHPLLIFQARSHMLPAEPVVISPHHNGAPPLTMTQIVDGKEIGFAASMGTAGGGKVAYRSATEIYVAGQYLNTTQGPAGVTQLVPYGGPFLVRIDTSAKRITQTTGYGGLGLSPIDALVVDPGGSPWALLNGAATFPSLGSDAWQQVFQDRSSANAVAVARIEFPTGTPARLEKVSGDRQTGVLQTVLVSPLVVRVSDADSQPVARAGVTFRPARGGAPVYRSTDAEGLASASVLLHDGPGTLNVQAEVQGLPTQLFTVAVRQPPLLGSSTNPRGASRVPTFQVSTVAGTPEKKDVEARTALGLSPSGVAVGRNGWIYFVEGVRPRILAIDTGGSLRVVAGTGVSGSTGDGGPATAARLSFPSALTVDTGGNLYVVDISGGVRRVDAKTGMISSFFSSANSPYTVCAGPSDNVYVLSTSYQAIFRVAPDGQSTRLVTLPSLGFPPNIACAPDGSVFATTGSGQVMRYKPSGESELLTARNPPQGIFGRPPEAGNARETPLGIAIITAAPDGSLIAGTTGREPYDKPEADVYQIFPDGRYTRLTTDDRFRPQRLNFLAAGPDGSVYWSDSSTRRLIRRFPGGSYQSLVNNAPEDGLPARSISLNEPRSVAVEPSGSILIADTWAFRFLRVDALGKVNTVLGGVQQQWASNSSNFSISLAESVSVSDTGEIALSSSAGLFVLRKEAPPLPLVTYARGSIPGRFFSFGSFRSIAHAPGGRLHYWESENGFGSLRSTNGVDLWTLSTWFNSVRNPLNLNLNGVSGMAADRLGNVFLSDSNTHSVLKLDRDGVLTRCVGDGTAGSTGDGGPASRARLVSPAGLTLDAKGNLYIAEAGANRIRMVTPEGLIFTIAGTGAAGFSGDGGAALSASFSFPMGLTVAASGDVYVADTKNNAIRVLSVTPPPLPFLPLENIASRQIAPLAPDQRAVIRGVDLTATAVEVPSGSLPVVLGGASVMIRDSAGKEEPAGMRAVGGTSVVFVAPAGLAAGPGLLKYSTEDGGRYEARIEIEPVSPGIYAANANGEGAPLADLERPGETAPELQRVYDCSEGTGRCVPARIEFREGEAVLTLALLTTGTRYGKEMIATIGDQEIPIRERASLEAGNDRIVVELPASLADAGLVKLQIRVDGKLSNSVDLLF